jgi:hypothetical protein
MKLLEGLARPGIIEKFQKLYQMRLKIFTTFIPDSSVFNKNVTDISTED